MHFLKLGQMLPCVGIEDAPVSKRKRKLERKDGGQDSLKILKKNINSSSMAMPLDQEKYHVFIA